MTSIDKVPEELDYYRLDEIQKVFDYFDEWKKELETPFTMDMFYSVFPQFSSRESKFIIDLWESKNKQ